MTLNQGTLLRNGIERIWNTMINGISYQLTDHPLRDKNTNQWVEDIEDIVVFLKETFRK